MHKQKNCDLFCSNQHSVSGNLLEEEVVENWHLLCFPEHTSQGIGGTQLGLTLASEISTAKDATQISLWCFFPCQSARIDVLFSVPAGSTYYTARSLNLNL